MSKKRLVGNILFRTFAPVIKKQSAQVDLETQCGMWPPDVDGREYIIKFLAEPSGKAERKP